jgi:hypothetical protein
MQPLLLTRIEPEEPGFDLRIYYCAGCGSNEPLLRRSVWSVFQRGFKIPDRRPAIS